MVLAMGAGFPWWRRESPAFPKSCRTARPDCWCRRRTPPRLARRWRRLLRDAGSRDRGWARRAKARVLPRFGVDGYVASVTALYDRLLARRRAGVKLGIVYHMPFWRAADGTLREVEGSFARYVDSLAPYFDEISLCVPVLDAPRGEGTADPRRRT